LEPVVDRATMNRFLALPWAIQGDDPNWVPPLLLERRQHLDPRKNPYFENAEVAYWLANRGTASLGRISAQVNRTHLQIHDDGTGHFGFLEAVDDTPGHHGGLAARPGPAPGGGPFQPVDQR
jgi:hypothetical protein